MTKLPPPELSEYAKTMLEQRRARLDAGQLDNHAVPAGFPQDHQSVESGDGLSPGVSTDSTHSTQDDDRALLARVRNGAWLDAQHFPPLRWAVPGLIPEGFSLLIGPPKAGKSWLILDVLLAIAGGGAALGRVRVEPAPCLYLALEDGDRRMQDRCRTLMAGQPLPSAFHYLTTVEPGAVPATVVAFLRQHPTARLVVIDTLGKVMPPAAPNETTYGRDYRVGGRIKALADAHPGLAVVALHHDRKAAAEDFVERVSGTNGLAGSADTVMVLARKRQADEGQLMITGRDVREDEYALTVTNGQWQLDGSTLEAAAVTARQRHDAAELGDRSTQIIRYVNAHPGGISPTKLGELMTIEPKHAGEYLRRLADTGRITKVRRGVYRPLHTTVESVESVEIAGGNLIQFPQDHASVENGDPPEDAS